MKNLRDIYLQSKVFDISDKFLYQVYTIKRDILGKEIKVKNTD